MNFIFNKNRNIMYSLIIASGLFSFLSAYFFSLPQFYIKDDSSLTKKLEDLYETKLLETKNYQGFHIALSMLSPWGKQMAQKNSVQAEPSVTSSAKFSGIIQSGTNKYVVFFDQKTQKLLHYKVQQQLPDGGQIVEINADSFLVYTNSPSEQELIKLYNY